MEKTLAIHLKELREEIAKEIREKRKFYLELCKDKESEDYDFYLGVCNGMNFAIVIAEVSHDN